MSKQDRQGVRTPADLERKYQFGKTFAEMIGLINETRESVDSVESSVRSEIAEQYTTIMRDAEKIMMEALTEYVKTGDYEEYKKTVSSEFKIMSDRITANLTSTESSITNVSSRIDSVNNDLQSTKTNIDSIDSDLQNTKTNLDNLDSDLQNTKENLDSLGSDLQSAKQDITGVEQDIQNLDKDLDEYTQATDTFKQTVTQELTDAANRLSGVEGDIEDANGVIDSVNKDLQNVKGDLELHYTASSEFQERCESEFTATAKQIALNMSSTRESFVSVNATLEDAQNDIKEQYEFSEELKEYCESEFEATSQKLELNFAQITEQITNINGNSQTVNENLEKYFEFGVNGLTIKAGENAMSLVIDNDIIKFVNNGQQFGWWDGVNFHTGNIVVELNERAQLGNFAFIPRSNGSLDFLKVGG